MATKALKFLTLKDVAAGTSDNKVLELAEVLNDTNEILDDIHWAECNNGTQHKSAQRTGLPEVALRQLNKGVTPSKSDRIQVTDTTAMMEGLSQIDEKMVLESDKMNAFRKNEDMAFTESMNETFCKLMFYGDTNQDQKAFLGLAPRYSDPAAANGEMLVNAGGAGSDNTSIFLGGWGPGKLSGLYPQGSKAGLEVKNNGRVKLFDANGGQYYGFETQFNWEAGLTVPDWRYAGRICNIDVSNLNGESAADLIKFMVILSERVKNSGSTRQAFYCTRKVRTALRLQMLSKSNIHISLEQIAGKKVLAFDGIPVRLCDAIKEDEPTIAGTFVEG